VCVLLELYGPIKMNQVVAGVKFNSMTAIQGAHHIYIQFNQRSRLANGRTIHPVWLWKLI